MEVAPSMTRGGLSGCRSGSSNWKRRSTWRRCGEQDDQDTVFLQADVAARAPGAQGDAPRRQGKGPESVDEPVAASDPTADGMPPTLEHVLGRLTAMGVPAQTWLSYAGHAPGSWVEAQSARGGSGPSATGALRNDRRAMRTRSTPNCSRWHRARRDDARRNRCATRGSAAHPLDGRPRAHGSAPSGASLAGGAPRPTCTTGRAT